ncbi:hypothetical protein [Kitasatospora sp. NPDC048407]|uniref:hypothetical protein n=1 Tax=Kitasatospora sp. NPDC048407 TaxID=3364051 RepID=UPI00371AC19A
MPTTRSAWIYDGTSLWAGDASRAIAARGAYATSKGLGGIFACSPEGDDPSGTLVNAMAASMKWRQLALEKAGSSECGRFGLSCQVGTDLLTWMVQTF